MEVRCRKYNLINERKRKELEEVYGVGFDDYVDDEYEYELYVQRHCG